MASRPQITRNSPFRTRGSTMADVRVGSEIFMWLSEYSGLPIDLVNFLISQLVALALSPVLRTVLHPTKASPAARHAFGLVLGLIMGVFCFGRQALHLAALPALCYVFIRTQAPRIMQRTVLSVALVYLSCMHLHRQFYDYGSYSIDITGPLMVITQKVSSLAFSIHDGLARPEKDLTPGQKCHVVRAIPTALEYFSYVFHFQALMCGPVIFYNDYMEYISGQNLLKHAPPSIDRNSNSHKVVLEPSAMLVVWRKVFASAFFALMYIRFQPMYHTDMLKDPDFVEGNSISELMKFLMLATTLARFKYYHAWLLADAICNGSGMGFNGYGLDDKPKWDLISNVDVIKFEMGLSLRDSIEQWNIGTTRWLRSIVYERTTFAPTLATYALSALWHGFYPGYYLTFLSGAFFTFVARTVRRSVRHHMLNPPSLSLAYDILTLVTTRLVMAYITFSFVLLEFWPSMHVYRAMYFWLHVCGLMALLVLPRVLPPQRRMVATPMDATSSKQNGLVSAPKTNGIKHE